MWPERSHTCLSPGLELSGTLCKKDLCLYQGGFEVGTGIGDTDQGG